MGVVLQNRDGPYRAHRVLDELVHRGGPRAGAGHSLRHGRGNRRRAAVRTNPCARRFREYRHQRPHALRRRALPDVAAPLASVTLADCRRLAELAFTAEYRPMGHVPWCTGSFSCWASSCSDPARSWRSGKPRMCRGIHRRRRLRRHARVV